MRKKLFILFLFASALSFGQNVMLDVVASSGSEEAVTNMLAYGDFSVHPGYWSLGDQWSISGGVATFDDTANGNISQFSTDMISATQASTAYTLSGDCTIASGNAIFYLQSTDGEYYITNVTWTNGSNSTNFTTPARS